MKKYTCSQANKKPSANINARGGTSADIKANNKICLIKAKKHLLPRTQVVKNAKICAQICHKILNEKQPICVDAEGVNLGLRGKMTLLQISTMDRKAFIFDVQTNSDLFTKGNIAHCYS